MFISFGGRRRHLRWRSSALNFLTRFLRRLLVEIKSYRYLLAMGILIISSVLATGILINSGLETGLLIRSGLVTAILISSVLATGILIISSVLATGILISSGLETGLLINSGLATGILISLGLAMGTLIISSVLELGILIISSGLLISSVLGTLIMSSVLAMGTLIISSVLELGILISSVLAVVDHMAVEPLAKFVTLLAVGALKNTRPRLLAVVVFFIRLRSHLEWLWPQPTKQKCRELSTPFFFFFFIPSTTSSAGYVLFIPFGARRRHLRRLSSAMNFLTSFLRRRLVEIKIGRHLLAMGILIISSVIEMNILIISSGLATGILIISSVLAMGILISSGLATGLLISSSLNLAVEQMAAEPKVKLMAEGAFITRRRRRLLAAATRFPRPIR
nr:uncharacterized transmembrane protein DDB_G0289901-like [Ipomoea batatas]GMD26021.1 uncharacterized transmembrane protein DDB_G0289901-like [Ipomoea batatas]